MMFMPLAMLSIARRTTTPFLLQEVQVDIATSIEAMTIAVISHPEFPLIKGQAQGPGRMEAIQEHQKGCIQQIITLPPHLLHPIRIPTPTEFRFI